eukprot:scaffold54358_cov36-Cyclotella_meneghiniana.AAC.10
MPQYCVALATRSVLCRTGLGYGNIIKEEGAGMRYHVNFEEYREERKAAEAEGIDLEVVRVRILDGWRKGVKWNDAEA